MQIGAVGRSLSTLLALLPRGRAWPRTVGTRLHDLMTAIAAEYERIDAAGRALLLEMVPDTATELLEDWERITHADECVEGATLEARRAAVVARLIGASPTEALVRTAIEQMGYSPTFEYWEPFTTGFSTAGDALTDDEWQHAIGVHVTRRTPTDDDVLECVVEHMQHAHVIVVWTWETPSEPLQTENGEELLTEDGTSIDLE